MAAGSCQSPVLPAAGSHEGRAEHGSSMAATTIEMIFSIMKLSVTKPTLWYHFPKDTRTHTCSMGTWAYRQAQTVHIRIHTQRVYHEISTELV